MTLEQSFNEQSFANEYDLVNGRTMNAENPENFHIPPDVIKRQIRPGQFVELRIDSPRFSIHEDAPEKCVCPTCNGETTKPILRHSHPATLAPIPKQAVPSRGWGEDFWAQVTQREGDFFRGVVDNTMIESRLHGLNLGDELVFHADNILAVHDVHRLEIVAGMSADDLKQLGIWLGDN